VSCAFEDMSTAVFTCMSTTGTVSQRAAAVADKFTSTAPLRFADAESQCIVTAEAETQCGTDSSYATTASAASAASAAADAHTQYGDAVSLSPVVCSMLDAALSRGASVAAAIARQLPMSNILQVLPHSAARDSRRGCTGRGRARR
jgi:hypothetical protein